MRVFSIFELYSVLSVWMILFALPVSLFANPQFHSLSSEHPDLFFQDFSELTGFNQSTVHDITQTREGLILLSTREGVYSFDGYKISLLDYMKSDPNYTSFNRVWQTLESSSGAIWIGSIELGLHVYNPVSKNVDVLNVDQHGGNNTVTSLFEAEGRIYVGTEGDGICTISESDYSDDPIECISLAAKFDLTNEADIIMDFAQSDDGLLWIATYGHAVFSYNPETDSFSHHIQKPYYAMSVLIDEMNDNLWIGTKDHGLIRHNLSSGEENYFIHNPDDPSSIPNNFIWPLLLDSNNNIWVGTFGSGLVKLILEEDEVRFITYQPDSENPYSFHDTHVLALFEDHNGLIWSGTDNNGFSNFNPNPSFSKPNLNFPENDTPFGNVELRHVFQDIDKRIWIATSNELFLDANTSGELNLISSESSINVNNVFQDHFENIWIGSNSGIFLFDEELKTLIPQFEDMVDRVFGFLMDHHDRLWIRTNRGLKYAEQVRDNWELRELPFPEISEKSMGQFFLHEESLWFEGNETELYQIELRAQLELHRLDDHYLPESAAVRSRITQFYTFDDELFIILRNGQINKISGNKSSGYLVTSILESDKIFRSATFDDQGFIWIVTQNGLLLFRPDDESIRKIRIPRGFDNGRISLIKAINNKSEIVLSGRDGSRVYTTTAQRYSARNNPVIISDIKVMNKPLYDFTFDSQNTTLTLPHNENFIEFEFALLDFLAPGNHSYHHKLDSVDDGWVQSDNRNFANYTSLAPGNYTFRVRAFDHYGFENQNQATIAISINPPYWGTAWFRILILLFAAGLVGYFYNLRVQARKQVERTRKQIADDLHDDIGSKVSSIGLMLDGFTTQYSDFESHPLLLRAVSTSRTISADIRDAIWMVDQNNDSWEALIERMHHSVNRLSLLKNFTFNVEISKFPELTINQRRHIWMIFKEALHNIAKHAKATEINIRIYNSSGNINLHIQDNGLGFDTNDIQKGRGSQTLVRRADEIGGNLKIQSAPGQGTRVHLVI